MTKAQTFAEAPEDIPKLFVAAWHRRSAEDIAVLFTEKAEFVNVVGIWWHNREDIRKAHDYGLKHIFQDSDLAIGKIKVTLLTETVAVVHARMRLRGQSPKGSVKLPETRYNIFSFVVQRFEDRWLCVSAQNTDIVPGAETNIVEAGKISGIDYRE